MIVSLHNVLLREKAFMVKLKTKIVTFFRVNKYYVKEKIAILGRGIRLQAGKESAERQGVALVSCGCCCQSDEPMKIGEAIILIGALVWGAWAMYQSYKRSH